MFQLQETDQICHPCWQRSDRAATHSTQAPHARRSNPTINLPNLTRAPDIRHISRKVYFVYILYHINEHINLTREELIKQYYCNCIVGRRTVGCCAHVMTVIWYLSWARYQENVNAPAQFLDNILLTYDSD